MTIRRDVVHAVRLLRRSPIFTVTSVVSLAIGIAANTAIFTLADTLLLREKAGLVEPERLVDIGRSQRGARSFDTLSYPEFTELRDRNTAFAGIAAYVMEPAALGLGSGDGADRVYGMPVSAAYFEVLGVRLARGRAFRPEEDRPGAPGTAVISHELWRRRFNSSPSVLGSVLRLNGRPFTVIGVAPERFTGHKFIASDLWFPIGLVDETTGRRQTLDNRQASFLLAIARLKPGVTLPQAQAAIDPIAEDLRRRFPRESEGRRFRVEPAHQIPGFMRTAASAFVGLLFVLVGLVLLIACTNVGGMLLARGMARSREVAIRLSVGASRGRIVRQLLTESVLLAMGGCVAGAVGALWLVGVLNGIAPALPIPVDAEFRLDVRVLAFSGALALLTGILFGLVPALQTARVDLVTGLKSDAAGQGPRRSRARQAFVVAQIAMSLLLVVCALLLGRSLRYAGSIDPGFDARNVDVAELDLRLGGYTDATGPQFAARLLERARQLPGVQDAALTRVLPLTMTGLGLGRLYLPGGPRDRRAPGLIQPDWNVVSPRYFDVMRTRIVAGRAFSDADTAAATPVAIVNETFARRAWPDGNAVGKTLYQEVDSDTERELVVVGVAQDGKYRTLGEEAMPFIYVPFAQQYMAEAALVVRRGERTLLPDIRTDLRQLDPHLPLIRAATLQDVTAVALIPQRLAAWIAAGVGAVGLLLASIGIYGLAAYNVTQRTREIGVRVALGATRRAVLNLVLRQSMHLAAVGIAIGLAAAAGVAQVLTDLLYGIGSIDPLSFAGGALTFAAVTAAAAWLPARRAAALDPVQALRAD